MSRRSTDLPTLEQIRRERSRLQYRSRYGRALRSTLRALAVAAGDAAAAIWFGVYAPFALAGSRIGEYFSKRRRRKA